jgi:hypothetical protein
MKKVTVAGGVQIDVCDPHGAWLDVGELQAIIAFHEPGHSTSPQPQVSTGVVGRLGRNLVSGVAHGAGFGAGTALARSLIHRLLG